MPNHSEAIPIIETYLSVQGESTHAGVPCIFIRTAGCPLRCRWCDSEFTFKVKNGIWKSPKEIQQETLARWKPDYYSMVQITGGEPLLYRENVISLIKLLVPYYFVTLETSGAYDFGNSSREIVPYDVAIIMDIKCPGSGMVDRNYWENLQHLKHRNDHRRFPGWDGERSLKDEVKFVVSSYEDFTWARSIIKQYRINEYAHVLFSPAMPGPSLDPNKPFKGIEPAQLVEWMLHEPSPARLSLQIHKAIWAKDARGV